MTSNFFNIPQIGQNLGNTNQPYLLGFYDLKIQTLMIYNPTLVPNVRKPSEEDIQDAKLIYYYPTSIAIQEKRNHVGLAEGNFMFWNSFFTGQEEDDEQQVKSTQNNQTQSQSLENKPIDLLSDDHQQTEEQKQQENPQSSEQSDQQKEGQSQDQQGEGEPKKPKYKQGKNFQILIFDRYIHAQEEVEENIWLYIVFAKPDDCDIKYKIFDEENMYYSEETGEFIDHRITENNIRGLLCHFYDTFWMFYSDMSTQIQNDKKQFVSLMDQFILRYLDLNGDEATKSLNVLRYQFQGFQYAPIEKNIFLTLQSLVNILSTMDNRIQHYSIFFSGYFIYSTLNHDKAFSMYEYLYSLDKPFNYSDRKIQQRFAFLQDVQKHEDFSYGNIFNSHRFGVSKSSQSNSQPGNTTNISGTYGQIDGFVEQTNETVNLQNIFFKGNNGEKEKYQMNVYYEKQLMIIMLYEQNQEIRKDKIIEMNTAISRNCEKIAGRIEKAITEQQKKEENYKYLYFNHMNIATKISNPLTLNQLLTQEIDTISNIYSQLQNDPLNHSSTQQLVKSANVWIYGYKNVSRVVIMIFPGAISLPKVYEEAEKLFKNYFPLLYM